MNKKTISGLRAAAIAAGLVTLVTVAYQDIKNDEYEPTTEAQAAFGRAVVDPISNTWKELGEPLNGPVNSR